MSNTRPNNIPTSTTTTWIVHSFWLQKRYTVELHFWIGTDKVTLSWKRQQSLLRYWNLWSSQKPSYVQYLQCCIYSIYKGNILHLVCLFCINWTLRGCSVPRCLACDPTYPSYTVIIISIPGHNSMLTTHWLRSGHWGRCCVSKFLTLRGLS